MQSPDTNVKVLDRRYSSCWFIMGARMNPRTLLLIVVLVFFNLLSFGILIFTSKLLIILLSLGVLAYTFGLRHAMDADHIAAIDNTTRKMMQEGKKPVSVGFFFSLGHSTVVFLLVFLLAFAAKNLLNSVPTLRNAGSVLGTGISAGFLYLIGIINLVILVDLIRIVRGSGIKNEGDKELEDKLLSRGFMNKIWGRVFRMVSSSWQMYPVGILFGLGFDTASEIALLAISVSTVLGNMPMIYVLILPLMFAAGMILIDTGDGIFMSTAYLWAFKNPVRKIFYNLTMTAVSTLIALVIGTIEIVQVTASELDLHGGLWDLVRGINLGSLGYVIVAVFVIVWITSIAIYRLRRIEERYGNFG